MNKIIDCCNCDLSFTRKNIVNGKGSTDASIIFIGEAPGYYEDKQGIPFVGNSGKLLDYYLELANLTLDKIYITNIVKCRPPENRMPTIKEINKCKYYFAREYLFIKPSLIVCLGAVASSILIPEFTKISDFRMNPVLSNNTLLLATYHPSYILQNKLFDLYYKDFYFIAKAYRKFCNPFHYCSFDDIKNK
jgi:uracil-DNA glycosylase